MSDALTPIVVPTIPLREALAILYPGWKCPKVDRWRVILRLFAPHELDAFDHEKWVFDIKHLKMSSDAKNLIVMQNNDMAIALPLNPIYDERDSGWTQYMNKDEKQALIDGWLQENEARFPKVGLEIEPHGPYLRSSQPPRAGVAAVLKGGRSGITERGK